MPFHFRSTNFLCANRQYFTLCVLIIPSVTESLNPPISRKTQYFAMRISTLLLFLPLSLFAKAQQRVGCQVSRKRHAAAGAENARQHHRAGTRHHNKRISEDEHHRSWVAANGHKSGAGEPNPQPSAEGQVPILSGAGYIRTCSNTNERDGRCDQSVG